jgi:hypothetical protein
MRHSAGLMGTRTSLSGSQGRRRVAPESSKKRRPSLRLRLSPLCPEEYPDIVYALPFPPCCPATAIRFLCVQAYARLLERRLLEVVPDHPLPVLPSHSGLPVSSLSRLAATAASALLASSGPPSQQQLPAALSPSGAWAAAPSASSSRATSPAGALAPLASKAASALVGAAAAHRREAVDAADTIRRLEKSVRSAGF